MISLGVDTIFQHLQITSLGVNTIFANAMFQLNCGCCRASAVAWVELSCFMPHGPADTVDACNKENLMLQITLTTVTAMMVLLRILRLTYLCLMFCLQWFLTSYTNDACNDADLRREEALQAKEGQRSTREDQLLVDTTGCI